MGGGGGGGGGGVKKAQSKGWTKQVASMKALYITTKHMELMQAGLTVHAPPRWLLSFDW